MAANNYFGFTHGGTQYAAAGTPAYQAAPQTGYAVAQTAAAAAAATYNPQRAPTGYDTYQAATHTTPGTYAVAGGTTPQATYDYSGYARTAQATAYDATKTYYQQTPATQAYSTADYQAASKSAYNAAATYTSQSVRPAATGPQHKTVASYTPATAYSTAAAVQQQPTPQANYTYAAQTMQTQQAPKVGGGGGGYNSGGGGVAVSYGNGSSTVNYSTGYNTQQNTVQTTSAATKAKTAVYSPGMYVAQGKPTNSTWQGYKKPPGGGMKQTRPKTAPKPQQLHYCEVCKISCAGPQTYREHLEGQRHKKKEALQKEGGSGATAASGGSGGKSSNNLRCELCDVVCTGSDAYSAHLRGAKHQKVVKLHTRLGKPIPEVDVKAAKAAAVAAAGGGGTATAGANTPAAASTPAQPPKINFVQSGNLGTVGKADVKAETKEETSTTDVEMSTENEVTPVGQEYIEEIKNDEGKLISFNCKLCECKFNDPNAKDMHMKGRRHRLQFKKKVNPELVVDVKPSGRRGRLHEEKMRRRDDMFRRRDDERSFWSDDRLFWEERRRYEEEYEYMEWMRRRGPGGPVVGGGGPGPAPPFIQPPPYGIRRPDTLDDRHIMNKHQAIYPKEPKWQAIHKIVGHCEKAMKLVSDQILEQKVKAEPKDAAAKKEAATTPAATGDKKPEVTSKTTPGEESGRVIKGVMRVGTLAKGLVLADENAVNLVVLCGEIPTKALLNQVYTALTSQLNTIAADEKYTVNIDVNEAALVVTSSTEPKISVTITLTSPLLREMLLAATEGDRISKLLDSDKVKHPIVVYTEGGTVSLGNQDALDQAKCLEALAQLRRAKWFQARPGNNQSSVMVIRLLRDLCHRNPTWAPISQWGIELLVDKVVGCVGFTSSEALRKVLEAIAGGILLPGGPGLADPCEREPTDATAHLTPQQRADITASAQHALRLMAFRQIHKVLGIPAIPPPRGGPRHNLGRFNRKRRRDQSASDQSVDSEDAQQVEKKLSRNNSS